MSLLEMQPPDDSGSDAFTRFHYQAHVAFRFCLQCYFTQGVVAVIPEHFEDVLVESEDELRFVQVKTRNLDRGPWKFRYLLDGGGALRSLLRTHRALVPLADRRRIVYDVRIEGALERSDAINRLATSGAGANDELCQECSLKLGCGIAEAESLLARVVIHSEPPRDCVEDRNLGDLRRIAGHLQANELKAIYEGVIDLIERAMRAELLANAWPAAIIEPAQAAEEVRRRIESKRINRERLVPLMGRLEGSNRALLARIADPNRLRATELERKMLAAGAPEALIEIAKQIRAQASRSIFEFRSSSTLDVDSLLADLEFRLLSLAQTTAATEIAVPPAAAIWRSVEERLGNRPGEHDPRRILNQEPLLMLGAICQYSDECKFGWGANA